MIFNQRSKLMNDEYVSSWFSEINSVSVKVMASNNKRQV